jgi:hypothetical protein
MDDRAFDPTTARRTKRRRALVLVLVGASLATLGAGTMSLAVFTDTDAAGGAWTTGSIVLGVQPNTTFGADDILPGDTGEQDITVSNTGTGRLRYALDVDAALSDDTDGLAAQMTLEIFAGTCAAKGASLYTGSLWGAALGDAAQGADTGDREVAAGDTDALCFAWELPLTTDNDFQAASTQVAFTFEGEQTKNND